MSDRNSVLIIGAGPTGLVLAIELARRGTRARVVEKASEPSKASRAKGLQPRTLELFHRLGLADAVLASGGQTVRFISNNIRCHYTAFSALPFSEIRSHS